MIAQNSRVRTIRKLSPDATNSLKTRQEFGRSSSIPSILKKYGWNGIVKHKKDPNVLQIDYSTMSTYHESLIQLEIAKENFLKIDPKIREFFKNDPERMYQFVADPQNKEKCIELGLMSKPLPKQKIDLSDETIEKMKTQSVPVGAAQ